MTQRWFRLRGLQMNQEPSSTSSGPSSALARPGWHAHKLSLRQFVDTTQVNTAVRRPDCFLIPPADDDFNWCFLGSWCPSTQLYKCTVRPLQRLLFVCIHETSSRWRISQTGSAIFIKLTSDSKISSFFLPSGNKKTWLWFVSSWSLAVGLERANTHFLKWMIRLKEPWLVPPVAWL